MNDRLVSQETINWLLESQTPSIRYLTRQQLLHQPISAAAVQADRQAIMASGPVPQILARQTPAGRWAGEKSYYTPKYVSSHWSMLLMTELAADPGDPRVRRGAEFMLADTAQKWGERLESGHHGMACFWGNLLRYALPSVPAASDERIGRIVAYLANEALDSKWRCAYNDEMPCAWGAARALWGLALCPPELRTERWKATLDAGLRFLLDEFALVQADYPTPGTVHSLWFRLNFPLFYQVDILFMLRVLAELDALDHPKAQEAANWLSSRRQKNGRWRGASPYRGRTWAGVAPAAESDRWATLMAASILEQAATS